MRATSVIAAVFAAGLLSCHLAGCGPTPAEQEAERARNAEIATKREQNNARRREEEKKRDERREAAAILIEEALAKLEADGVERDDVSDYFYDEIEEEVCFRRACQED